MKITDVSAFAVYNGQRNNLFVVVDTDEGIYGVGESGLSGRELAVIGAVEHLKPLVVGEDPSRIEHLWQILFRGGFFPANRVIGSAISAIDIALWDIQGKALGVPVYKLLGGQTRDRIRVYGTAGGRTPEEAAASIKEAVALGFNCIKVGSATTRTHHGRMIEPPSFTEEQVEIFAAMRAAVGLKPYAGATDATAMKALIADERRRVQRRVALIIRRLNIVAELQREFHGVKPAADRHERGAFVGCQARCQHQRRGLVVRR